MSTLPSAVCESFQSRVLDYSGIDCLCCRARSSVIPRPDARATPVGSEGPRAARPFRVHSRLHFGGPWRVRAMQSCRSRFEVWQMRDSAYSPIGRLDFCRLACHPHASAIGGRR